jgi:hypothetical protein
VLQPPPPQDTPHGPTSAQSGKSGLEHAEVEVGAGEVEVEVEVEVGAR